VGNKRPLTTEIVGVLIKYLKVIFFIGYSDHGYYQKFKQYFEIKVFFIYYIPKRIVLVFPQTVRE
jgi:hypothetical protein